MTIPANSIAAVLAFGGVRGQSPLGERVAALRQAQGPWDLWLAKESEGETTPFKKNRAGLLTNWIFEFIFSAQVCSLWCFFACMPEELTMKKDVAASAAEAEIYLAIPHIALLTICSRLATF